MRQNVQVFVGALLDHSRTSHELEVMLNYNPLPGSDVWEPGERQTLERLKLAINYKQKQVCHSACIINPHYIPVVIAWLQSYSIQYSLISL